MHVANAHACGLRRTAQRSAEMECIICHGAIDAVEDEHIEVQTDAIC